MGACSTPQRQVGSRVSERSFTESSATWPAASRAGGSAPPTRYRKSRRTMPANPAYSSGPGPRPSWARPVACKANWRQSAGPRPYNASSCCGCGSRKTCRSETSPLVGRSCPDFELEDGTRLGTLLQDGNGLLLDFGGRASLQALDGLWGDHVKYVASDAKDRLGLSALLVRPDGFVAWASDTTPSLEEVTRAAARWFASRGHHAISS